MHVVRRDITNLIDIVFVWTVAGIAVPLVESSKAVAVSIDVVVVLPGTLGDKVIDCKHPGVVVMGFSIIFASNL